MSFNDLSYHRERERHCRSQAQLAAQPDIRRRHEELAALHAGRALLLMGFDDQGASGIPG